MATGTFESKEITVTENVFTIQMTEEELALNINMLNQGRVTAESKKLANTLSALYQEATGTKGNASVTPDPIPDDPKPPKNTVIRP